MTKASSVQSDDDRLSCIDPSNGSFRRPAKLRYAALRRSQYRAGITDVLLYRLDQEAGRDVEAKATITRSEGERFLRPLLPPQGEGGGGNEENQGIRTTHVQHPPCS
jgi:hypothetical protein